MPTTANQTMPTTADKAARSDQQGRTGAATELSDLAAHAVAFLLSQLGAHATVLFSERIASLDLTPPQVGFLRLVGSEPGSSQQALADRLGMAPSRLVPLVDGLEERGLVERRRDPRDRRNHALHLTTDGGRLMGQLRKVAVAHEDAVCAGLDSDERDQLRALLERIAAHQGLKAGIHPGYRHMGQ
jgi:DNA-binding MarR family transcriptional regulator